MGLPQQLLNLSNSSTSQGLLACSARRPALPCDLIKSRSCIHSSPHQLIAAPSAAPIDFKPPPGSALSSRLTEPSGLIFSGPRLTTVRRRVWTEDLTVS